MTTATAAIRSWWDEYSKATGATSARGWLCRDAVINERTGRAETGAHDYWIEGVGMAWRVTVGIYVEQDDDYDRRTFGNVSATICGARGSSRYFATVGEAKAWIETALCR